MFIKRVTVNDFKKFEGEHTFTFDKINLISGENGTGKTSIGLHSILFALYGYSKNKLEKYISKNIHNSNTWVEVEILHHNNTYIIKRSIPTKIDLTVNGVKSTLANNVLKQAEIESVFEDVEFFRKFRMIDITASIDILEQSQTNLRKTLVDFDNGIDLTPVRSNLSNSKNQRELYNKDTKVLYKCYPSENRYNVLRNNYYKNEVVIEEQDTYIEENEQILRDISNKISRYEAQKNIASNQKAKLLNTRCHACGQTIKINKQQELLNEVNAEIVQYNQLIANEKEEYVIQKEVIEQYKLVRDKVLRKQPKLQNLIHRLDARLKQKDYIWSNADVEIMKQAIKEVDGFSTYYITSKLKNLEPIINNILNKVNFSVSFNVTDKNKFDIKIQRNNVEYDYSELSNGEKLLVGTAFQLSLLMEKNHSGVVVADEGFSSLDQKNLETIFDLFVNSPFQLISVVHRYSTTSQEVKNITL